MLKPIINYILPVLTSVFNHSLQYSTYPEIWKEALIRAVPKVSKPKSASDFRPISLLSII